MDSPHIALKFLIALALLVAAVPAVAQNPPPSPPTHVIHFTFNYDFKFTPACSSKVKVVCVQQFNFYDISQGIDKRVKLGSTPVKPGAKGFVKGLTGASAPQVFNPGRHRVAVAAQLSDGRESDLRQCSAVVVIP